MWNFIKMQTVWHVIRNQSKNNTAAAEKWTGNEDFIHNNSDILQILAFLTSTTEADKEFSYLLVLNAKQCCVCLCGKDTQGKAWLTFQSHVWVTASRSPSRIKKAQTFENWRCFWLSALWAHGFKHSTNLHTNCEAFKVLPLFTMKKKSHECSAHGLTFPTDSLVGSKHAVIGRVIGRMAWKVHHLVVQHLKNMNYITPQCHVSVNLSHLTTKFWNENEVTMFTYNLYYGDKNMFIRFASIAFNSNCWKTPL